MADGQVTYEIRGDNSKFQQDVNQTEAIARGKTSAISGFAKTAVIGIGAAVAAVGAGMVAFSKDAIGVGSQFDAAMSQVAATMGTTVDQIGNLTDFAMEMGATTAFSATEAAEALNYMALAGYDAETSMSMLPNVLNLAAAGNIGLARASDMVTDAQTALGLTLPQTEKLVDQMAKTSSKTNTSVEQLGDAILTVGGTAKNLAGGTTELATVLGVLADNGIKGAEGGTALRNIILALSAPTDQAAKALDDLGVSAYDADGNLRALPEVFADLNGAMEGMTQGQKTEVLNTIFNKVDLKAANALLATSADRFTELSDAIENASGAAQTMAEVQLDNLAGDVTMFKSALEGAKITLSNALTPALRNFVQMGTKEIGKLDKAFKLGGIEGLGTQMGKSLGLALDQLVKYVPKFVSAVGNLALSLASSLASSLTKNFPKILRAGIDLFKKFGQNIAQQLPSLLGGIGSIIGEVLANVPNLLQIGANIIVEFGKGLLQGIPQLATGLWGGIKGMFSKPVSDDVFEAQQYISDLKEEMKSVGTISGEMAEAMNSVLADKAMADYWLDIYDKLYQKTNLTKGEQELLNQAVKHLQDIFPELGSLIDEETGKWKYNTDEIRANIEMLTARAKADVYYDKIRENMERIIELEGELSTAEAASHEARMQYDAAFLEHNRYESLYTELQALSSLPIGQQWAKASDALLAYAASVGVTEGNVLGLSAAEGYLYEDWQNSMDAMNEAKDSWDAAKDKVEAQKDAIEALEAANEEWAKSAVEAVESATETAEEIAKGSDAVGTALGDGVIAGLEARRTQIAATARSVTQAALHAMKATAMIASPSKKARKEVGEQIGMGEALGMEDSIPQVKKSAEKLINSIDFALPNESLTVESDNSANQIIAVLNKYLPRIGSPIVLDTGELVGATVDKYDHELGILQQRRARYE